MSLYKTLALASQVINLCIEKQYRIATVESCTGGLISSYITSIPGSSQVFEFGYVAYSSNAKNTMLGIDTGLISRFGDVSIEIAKEMAQSGLLYSKADFCISVTGFAGPAITEDEKVGLVYIAMANKASTLVKKYQFYGDRAEIREQIANRALTFIIDAINQPFPTSDLVELEQKNSYE